MRSIFLKSNNCHYNLATEEYFLKNSTEELFLIYINEPCIIVGKHQNLLSEINLPFILENRIKLARRISGGGTVYQDNNNLNFSFIHNCKNLENINFKRFTSPVLEVLESLGLNVAFSERNDLLIDNKKISGNAMHIFKNRVLSHGTLLFNSDLNQLSQSLNNNSQKYTDKAIKSVPSKVTNILPYLNSIITMNEFSQAVFNGIIKKTLNSFLAPLTEPEESNIQRIFKEKFEKWDWIYGYSPKYLFRNCYSLQDQLITFSISVEKGIIRSVDTNINNSENTVYQYLFNSLLNVNHDYNTISDLLTKNKLNYGSHLIRIREFCDKLF